MRTKEIDAIGRIRLDIDDPRLEALGYRPGALVDVIVLSTGSILIRPTEVQPIDIRTRLPALRGAKG